MGGAWWWNRYPGARCDVETLQYYCAKVGEIAADGWRGFRFARETQAAWARETDAASYRETQAA